MSNQATMQFYHKTPPAQSTTPGTGVTRLATSTTAASFDLSGYPLMFGRRLTFMNESTTAGDSIYITFASSSATAVDAAQAGGATIAAGTVAANGFKLLPGESVEWRLDRVAHTFLHVDALANTPVLCIYPSSGPDVT